MAVTWKKLAFEDDAVLKALFDANTILAADSDNTPAAVTVAEQTVVGRITGGNIVALTATQIRTLINVADGATASVGDFLADGSVPMTDALDFAGHQAEDMVIHTVADATAKTNLTPVVGKLAFQTDELSLYLCTVSA